ALGGGEPGPVARGQRRVVDRGRIRGAGRRTAVIDDGRGGGVRALVGVRARTRDAERAAAARHRRVAGRAAVTPGDGGAGEVGRAGPRVGVAEGGPRPRRVQSALGGGEPGPVARGQRRVVDRGRIGGAGRRPAVIDDGCGGREAALL